MSLEMEPQSLTEPPKGRADGGHAASSLVGQKKDIPGTPTPERIPDSPSSTSSTGEICSICLGSVTDKCVADSCLHSFCLLCLKEWSKQKAVCPLCKLSFTKIMYEIKSESEYKEWIVPQPEPAERHQATVNFEEFLNAETRRFFGYRTTFFPGAATLRRLHARSNILDAIPSLPRQRRPRSNHRGTIMFRLSIYVNNVWVQPLADITGRYRQTSPELYREQPALTHRLVPWVNRELAALISPSRIGTVLTEVMDLIERYPINSREFRAALRPHLHRRTQHFVHEFYHFARSPYDMVGHDNASQYVPRYVPEESSDGSDTDDSDAVVEVDSVGNPIASTSASEGNRNQSAPGNVAREETLTQEGSVVISSSDESDDEREGLHSHNTEASFDLTHNPEPPSCQIGRNLGGFYMHVNEGASTSRSGSASGRSADQSARPLQDNATDNYDSDECIIVEEVVPSVPTPELIEIDSEDEESHSKSSVRGHLKVIRTRRKLRGKSKPKLKRNNFVASENSSKDYPSNECNIAQQDHSYCTEDGADCNLQVSSSSLVPDAQEPSTSSTSVLDEQRCLESSNQRIIKSEYESDPTLSEDSETKEVLRCDISTEEFESQENVENREVRAMPSKKRKHNRESSSESVHSVSKKRRASNEQNMNISVPRKDLNAKIKSSLFPLPTSRFSKSKDKRHRSKHGKRSTYSSSSDSYSRKSSEKRRKHKSHSSQHKKIHDDSSIDSSEERWHPSSSRAVSSSTINYKEHDYDSSSETSCSEEKDAYRSTKKSSVSSKLKKSSKKHKRRSKDKRDRVKSSGKKSAHKKKSRSKRYDSDSDYSGRKRHRSRSGQKKRYVHDDSSDGESRSYLEYKRTTVKVKIRNDVYNPRTPDS